MSNKLWFPREHCIVSCITRYHFKLGMLITTNTADGASVVMIIARMYMLSVVFAFLLLVMVLLLLMLMLMLLLTMMSTVDSASNSSLFTNRNQHILRYPDDKCIWMTHTYINNIRIRL